MDKELLKIKLNITDEELEKLEKILNEIATAFKRACIGIIDTFKETMKNIDINKYKAQKKYRKRVENRNKLHKRRKAKYGKY
ncbi:hypothetical protein JCM1393_21410 [Clostridium carnis]